MLPGIMACPEDIEQLPVGDHGRIEIHLDRLDVISEVVVRGVLRRPSRVPDTGAENAGETPEPGVRTPESAQGERRRLRRSRKGHIERRCRRGPRRGPIPHPACHCRLLRSRLIRCRVAPRNRGREIRRDRSRRKQSEKDRSPDRFHGVSASRRLLCRSTCPSVAERPESLHHDGALRWDPVRDAPAAGPARGGRHGPGYVPRGAEGPGNPSGKPCRRRQGSESGNRLRTRNSSRVAEKRKSPPVSFPPSPSRGDRM